MGTALITGASTGIGLELARLFAKDKHRLILVARNAARLTEVAGELAQAGAREIRTLSIDLAAPHAAEQIMDGAGDWHVDFLVNNAGFGAAGHFGEIPLSTQLEMMQVNMTAVVELTYVLLPGMQSRGMGKIMNVASTAAFQPGPLMAIYYASKSFVLSFSEALSEELKGSGVTVTALCPGPTKTEFQKRAGLDNAVLFEKSPMGVMTAAEVAEIGYVGMMSGHVVVIPGFLNKAGVQLLRLGPRAIVRKAAKAVNENTKK